MDYAYYTYIMFKIDYVYYECGFEWITVELFNYSLDFYYFLLTKISRNEF